MNRDDSRQNTSKEGVEVARNTVRGFSGATVRRLRIVRGLASDDFADLVGASVSAVWSWETGRTAPTPPTLVRIAQVLHVTPADLIAIPEHQLTLSDLRVEAGYTQADAARALDLSPNKLLRIEKGRLPSDPDITRKIATLYGISTERVASTWAHTVATRAARLDQM